MYLQFFTLYLDLDVNTALLFELGGGVILFWRRMFKLLIMIYYPRDLLLGLVDDFACITSNTVH